MGRYGVESGSVGSDRGLMYRQGEERTVSKRTGGNGGDAVGTALALLVGVLVGVGVATPALPASASLRFGGIVLGPVEAALLAAALSVLLIPLGTFALYQLFVFTDQ